MIDVHVLVHSETRHAWLRQCLESLADEPCIVHVLRGTEGSVGAGRARGYRCGIQPYVAFVDSDDYVLPGVMDACVRALETHRSVVCLERVMHPDGTFHPYPKPGHNMAVYRRDDVAPWLTAMDMTPHTTDIRMRSILRPHQLDMVGYVWRIHEGGDHRKINQQVCEQERLAWQ